MMDMNCGMPYTSRQPIGHPTAIDFVHAGPAVFMTPKPKEQLMARFRSYLQHRFNPLHIYCRLCDHGFSQNVARRLSSVYERLYRVCGLGMPKA